MREGKPDVISDLWYKSAVIYNCDVRTFLDSNGDGVGDFRGLQRRLDYLAGLGITALWLMPFYASPDRDDGPEKSMQLYDRGIRRRLPPMLNGDQRRLRMAMSLMFTLPGTPVVRYGDEIGMGDDLGLEERQWR